MDSRPEFKVFQILGPRQERPFCPVLLFRRGIASLFLDLRGTLIQPARENTFDE